MIAGNKQQNMTSPDAIHLNMIFRTDAVRAATGFHSSSARRRNLSGPFRKIGIYSTAFSTPGGNTQKRSSDGSKKTR
jgi:hypothetical protein